MQQDEESIQVVCAECASRHRNHRILCEKKIGLCEEPGEAPHTTVYHRFVQCMGCGSFKYVISKTHPQSEFEEIYPHQSEYDFKVYPDAPSLAMMMTRRDAAIDRNEAAIPDMVWKMYSETLQALNAGIRTLAAGGLRATVEAICLQNGLTTGNLQKKIDELANQNLLTKSQAELLHEERYLGNAALHELETPSSQAIEDGLGIVEGLITTIYVLPAKAKRLREARESKGTP